MRTLTLTGNRMLMLLFVILFLAPIFWVQQAVQRGWLDDAPRVTHHGVRIHPPVGIVQLGPELEQTTLTADMLRHNWWLVYILPSDCHAGCRVQLERMQQAAAELAAGGLQLLVADPGGANASVITQLVDRSASDMHWLAVSANATNQALSGWITTDPQPTEAGHLYIMNPQGSLMMHYSVDTGAEAIVADLARLLP